MGVDIMKKITWHSPIINKNGDEIGFRWDLEGEQQYKWKAISPKEDAGIVIVASRSVDTFFQWIQEIDVFPEHILFEIDFLVASDVNFIEKTKAAFNRGLKVCISGKPTPSLNQDVLATISYAVIPWKDDQRRFEERKGLGFSADNVRKLPFMNSGMTNWYDVNMSFKLGASAVVGWPWGAPSQQNAISPDERILITLIRQINEEAENDEIQNTIKKDPSVMFRMLKYLSSPVFKTKFKISTIQQAIVLVGRDRLKTWLATLLMNATGHSSQKIHRLRALRRGFFLEKLGNLTSKKLGDQLFMVGAFSLVDKLWGWDEETLRKDSMLVRRMQFLIMITIL